MGGYHKKHETMKRLLYLGIALFLIVFESVPEGLALAGHKTVAGVIEFVFLAGITLTVFAYFTQQYPHPKEYFVRFSNFIPKVFYSTYFWYYIAGYALLRFATFDIIHNISAGLPVFYLGDTKLFDVIMTKLASWGWFVRFICGIIGITWLLKK